MLDQINTQLKKAVRDLQIQKKLHYRLERTTASLEEARERLKTGKYSKLHWKNVSASEPGKRGKRFSLSLILNDTGAVSPPRLFN